MASGVALQVAQPNINPVGYFNASQQQAQQQQAAALEQKKQGLQGIFMFSAGMTRNGADPDPQEWEQGLDWLSAQGADPAVIDQMRGNPSMAHVLKNGSAEALRYSLDAQQFDFALKKFEQEPASAASAPKPVTVNDQLVSPDTGEVIGDYRDPQAQYRPITPEEAKAYNLPGDGSFQVNVTTNEIEQIGGGGQTINVGNDDPFGDTLAGAEAKMFAGFIERGPTAARTLAQLGQLEARLENVETGGVAAFKQMAGNFGINIEGLSDIQAAQALINQMVPAQRPPGSGPMSDADLELFKQSVPRLINQPGGNQLIIDTMVAINEYDLKLAQIAQQAASEELTREEARAAVNAIQNPLDDYGKRASEVAKEKSDGGGQTFTTSNGIEYSF